MIMCLKNNIKIYYHALDSYSGKIVIDDNGVIKVGDKIYKDQSVKHGKNEVGWWKIVEKLYTQEYMKLPEQLKQQESFEIDLEIYLKINKARENQIMIDCNPVKNSWVSQYLTEDIDV